MGGARSLHSGIFMLPDNQSKSQVLKGSTLLPLLARSFPSNNSVFKNLGGLDIISS